MNFSHYLRGRGRVAKRILSIHEIEDGRVLETSLSSFSETNMAACSALKRSVLDVDGKSFDVVLSHTSLSWGHVGIEEYGKKIKYFYNVFN